MKSFTLAVAVAGMSASVFAATDTERIEALEKKVAELRGTTALCDSDCERIA